MSTIHRAESSIAPSGAVTAPASSTTLIKYAASVARLSLGWVFLWAFLDKAFGLGHDTASSASWVNGGSPTKGFLGMAAAGPFAGVYHRIAGQGWADVLFMLGLLAIGSALMLGVAMRLAAGAGALLVVLMWTAVLPPANNLSMHDHLIYAVVLVLLAALGAGHALGLGARWESLPVVGRTPWLR